MAKKKEFTGAARLLPRWFVAYNPRSGEERIGSARDWTPVCDECVPKKHELAGWVIVAVFDESNCAFLSRIAPDGGIKCLERVLKQMADAQLAGSAPALTT